MQNIKISTIIPKELLLRQSPGSKGIWGDCCFFINEEIEECDCWVVYGGLSKFEEVICPPENTIFIALEPSTIKEYNPKFLKQFGKIISCDRRIEHRNVKYNQQSQLWHIGRRWKDGKIISLSKGFDELQAQSNFKKEKLISVIVSKKNFTEGHRKRLKFIEKLRDHFGTNIDVFGRGINDIEDKWDAIEPYKYHIVLENSNIPDYWTEKLSDALLAGSYPFYYGCPNISDYFPKNSLTKIDIEDIENSVSIIENTIKYKKYEKSIEDISKARKLVLNKYNLFPMISEICMESSVFEEKRVKIKPEKAFSPKKIQCLKDLIKRF